MQPTVAGGLAERHAKTAPVEVLADGRALYNGEEFPLTGSDTYGYCDTPEAAWAALEQSLRDQIDRAAFTLEHLRAVADDARAVKAFRQAQGTL